MPATTGAEIRTLDERGQEAGQRLDADAAQRRISPALRGVPGRAARELDDGHRTTDHGQCAAPMLITAMSEPTSLRKWGGGVRNAGERPAGRTGFDRRSARKS